MAVAAMRMSGTDTTLLDPFFAAVSIAGQRDALVLLENCRRRCDAFEAQLLAARVGAGDEGEAKRLLRLAGVSRRDSSRRVGRARVVGANPVVGQQLAAGVVSGEQVDVIASADRHSDGAASADPAFVEEVLGSSPDAGSGLRKQWLAARLSAAEVEEKYRRQHAGRHVWRHRTEAGLAAITVAGDDATVDQLWTRIRVAADRGYKSDGGRDVPAQAHTRSYPQRLFDGVADLVTGTSGKGRSGSGRPSVVLTVNMETLLGRGSVADSALRTAGVVGEQVGTGPVADAVIIDALKHADLWTLVSSPSGQPLWCGRSRRDASRAQLIAMICRDRGCVETGEHWSCTDAHHIVGWNAPGRGRSDVDQMVLLSESVHRDIHAADQTFEYDPAIGKWRRRNAKPHERSRRRRPEPTGPGSPGITDHDP